MTQQQDPSRNQQRTATELLTAYADGKRMFAYWNLAGVDLPNATLKDANFFRASLKGANLSGADLTRCNLSQVTLTGANMRGANISQAYLDGAVTFGADLTDVITDRPTNKESAPPATSSSPSTQPTTVPAAPATAATSSRFCVYCGASMPAEGSFCAACGKKQPNAASATPSAATSSVASSQAVARSAAQKPRAQSATDTTLGPVVLIGYLIGEGWNLIVRIAIVIIVIVGVVAFVKSCATNATLNEHSSCGQFQQADADTQNRVLQDMMTAHHDQGSISTTRASLTLYCALYGDSAPIDGIYGSGGSVGQQDAHPLYTGDTRNRAHPFEQSGI